jgi:acyl-CoA synthetase (AMP-forming)/AMP-acid ligase II
MISDIFSLTSLLTAYKDNVFLEHQEKNIIYSFADLHQLILKTSLSLKENGIRQGQYVALSLSSPIELIQYLLSLWYINAIPVIINHHAPQEEVKRCKKHVPFDLIITSENKFSHRNISLDLKETKKNIRSDITCSLY